MIEKISRSLMGRCGVYALRNQLDDCYIGASSNLFQRLSHWRHQIKHGRVSGMFVSANRDSELVPVILEFCKLEELGDREFFYIRTLNPNLNRGRSRGFMHFSGRRETHNVG